MKQYQSPQMKFEELTFFEKIAEKCWGSKSVVFDYPNDDAYIPYTFNLASGCGNISPESVNQWIDNILSDEEFAKWTADNVNNSSNMANTKLTGFIQVIS